MTRNVISGNTGVGVFISGSGSDSNIVQGNYVGLNAAGTGALGNIDNGLQIDGGAKNNTIGGTAAGAGNVIASNNTGIRLRAVGTTGNLVIGNLIGTNSAGTAAIGNILDGMRIDQGTTGNTIGGTTSSARNIISGNARFGILITDSGTSNNAVQGNYIGTDVNGTADLGNTSDGIHIQAAASSNTIGGTTAGAGNVVSGNDGNGVTITGSGTTGNTVAGNYIGTDLRERQHWRTAPSA